MDEFQDQQEYDTTGVKIASILFWITSAFLGLVSLLQFLVGLVEEDSYLTLLSGWNVVVTVAFIFIGIGVWKTKSWAYSWGMGTAGLNLGLEVIQVIISGALLSLFFIPLDIAILVILYKNKYLFNIADKLPNTENYMDYDRYRNV